MSEDAILNDIKVFIKKYPVNCRGGVTRLLVNNKVHIDSLLNFYNFKELIELINSFCDVNISYYNAKKVFNSISKVNFTGVQPNENKATVTATQTNQEVVKPARNSIKITEQQNKKINDDGLTEEEAKNPIFHIKNVKIPKTFKRELLDEGVTLEEVKALKMEYYSISEAVNKLTSFLTRRKEIEREKELDELFKIKKGN